MHNKCTGTVYRIVVRSELSARYAVAFEGMKVETRNGETILSGEVVDQAHLFSLLNRVNALGLHLRSVQALPEGTYQKPEKESRARTLNQKQR